MINRPQSGRPHLDGSLPGAGQYLARATVSLPLDDIEALEEIGAGNRSAAVRQLLQMWRQDAGRDAGQDAGRDAGQDAGQPGEARRLQTANGRRGAGSERHLKPHKAGRALKSAAV